MTHHPGVSPCQVSLLVAGKGCGEAAKAAATVNGVSHVFLADDASLAGGLAETLTPLLLSLQDKHSAYGEHLEAKLAHIPLARPCERSQNSLQL